MFGFLLKIIVFAAIVGGIGYVVVNKKTNLPPVQTLKSEIENTIKHFDTKTVTGNLSASLDSLVTNPDSKSPVVLGVKISNDSIGKVVDVLQSLPPDQISQIRSVLCALPTPASASESSVNH